MLFSKLTIDEQKKLHEHYFPFTYIETGTPISPVGSYHQSIKPLVH